MACDATVRGKLSMREGQRLRADGGLVLASSLAGGGGLGRRRRLLVDFTRTQRAVQRGALSFSCPNNCSVLGPVNQAPCGALVRRSPAAQRTCSSAGGRARMRG